MATNNDRKLVKGSNYSEILFRKVKVLGGRAKAQAKEKGYKDDDLVLVLVKIVPKSLSSYEILKVEGDPIEFLFNRLRNMR